VAAGPGSVVVVGGAEVVVVVVGAVLVDVVDGGGGAALAVPGTGLVVGVTMTTVGGGRVGTVVMWPRLVVGVTGRVVVVDEAVVVELDDAPGVLTREFVPVLEENAYQTPTAATSRALPAMVVTTRRSIIYLSPIACERLASDAWGWRTATVRRWGEPAAAVLRNDCGSMTNTWRSSADRCGGREHSTRANPCAVWEAEVTTRRAS